MKSRSDIDKTRITAVVEPICQTHGVELVDVVYAREPGGAVLRILIDRERPAVEAVDGVVGGAAGDGAPKAASGVTLEDCKAVSRDISAALDANEEALPSARYRLEVGSPGLDRPLVKLRDFLRFVGAEAKIQTAGEVPGAEADRRRFSGVLRGVTGDHVHFEEVGVPGGPRTLEIPFDSIQKAHLVPRFGK